MELNHDALVRTANELSPLPQAVFRLAKHFAEADYEVSDVAQTIQLDPVLAAKLLRLANSAIYGGGRVGSLGEAIVRLGAGSVRSLAISESARPNSDLDLSAFGLSPATYWRHCVAVMSFAEEMRSRQIAGFGDDFPTGALLHDFGKLVLAAHLTVDHIQSLRNMDPMWRNVDREMAVLGVNHAEVTAVVCQAWNLPDDLVSALQHHHDPQKCDTPLCHGLNIANQLAWKAEARNLDRERERKSRVASMSALSMNETQAEAVFQSGLKRFEVSVEIYS